jgi:ABC-type lipoprotein release transport system permease subunit
VGLIGSTLGLAGGLAVLRYLDPIERCFLDGRSAVCLLWLLGLVTGYAVIAGLLRHGRWRLLVLATTFLLWTPLVMLLMEFNYLDGLVAFGRHWLSWTPWPRDVFYFERIPRDIGWGAMLSFWAGGILVSFAASIIPAVRAARTDPVHTLRYEH